jgi:hypothetical protein
VDCARSSTHWRRTGVSVPEASGHMRVAEEDTHEAHPPSRFRFGNHRIPTGLTGQYAKAVFPTVLAAGVSTGGVRITPRRYLLAAT